MTKYLEIENKLQEYVNQYNDELSKKDPSKTVLDDIEENISKVSKEGEKALIQDKYNHLIATYSNPMLEAARNREIEVPAVRYNKQDKRVTSAEVTKAVRVVNPVKFTEQLNKLSAKDGYVNTGVFANGASWQYRTEKLAFHFILAVAKDLGFGKEALKSIEKDYRMKDVVRQQNLGKDVTTNTQLVNQLQEIVDKMVFVPDAKFPEKNAIKVTTADVNYLKNIYASAARQCGVVKVLAGKNMPTYVFNAVHQIVTGKPYEIDSRDIKDANNHAYRVAGAKREAIAVSAERAKVEQAA